MTEVGVVIGTYGGEEWKTIAQNALQSIYNQTVETEVVHHHARSLAQARNEGASMISSEWIIFCDADDTLDSNYVKEMLNPIDDSTLRQPSTLGVYPDGTTDNEPVLIPKTNLLVSNYLVIGTMCRREDFLSVGGFDERLEALEDWDLWIRIWKNGGIIGSRPKAIYRVGVLPDSRNKDVRGHGRAYSEIRKRHV